MLTSYLPPVLPIPDDHFSATPNCRVNRLGQRARWSVLVAVQLSGAGIVSPAGVQDRLAATPAPDDHFTASPHCRVTALGQRARWSVLVAVQLSVLGLYLPPVFKIAVAIISAPDDHFTAGPNCRVRRLGQRARWSCWWLSNCPCWDCISRRCSTCQLHHLRPRRSFHCRSTLPCEVIGQRARWWC